MPSQEVALSVAWQNLTTLASLQEGDSYTFQANDPQARVYLYESAAAPMAGVTGMVILPFQRQQIEQPASASIWIRASEACKCVITNL